MLDRDSHSISDLSDRLCDPAAIRYREQRMAHWNQESQLRQNPHRPGTYYHQLLQHYFSFLIPAELRLLELGCGHGDLLAGLNPTMGVGIDFSEEMVQAAKKKTSESKFYFG